MSNSGDSEDIPRQVSYWQAVCSGCTISDSLPQGTSAKWAAIDLPPSTLQDLRTRMDTDGYFHLATADLPESFRTIYTDIVAALAGAVSALVALGWPASFVTIFDQACLFPIQLSRARAHTLTH
jgi:hypothetical protein